MQNLVNDDALRIGRDPTGLSYFPSEESFDRQEATSFSAYKECKYY